MDSLNMNWNEEVTKSTGKNFGLFQKATIALLALSCAVSIYVALFFVGSGSVLYYALLAGGAGRIVVASYCLKNSKKAFQVAGAFAVITSAIDVVSSGGIYFATIIYLVPQALVVVFSRLALREMPQDEASD
jgi:hypothetical protein